MRKTNPQIRKVGAAGPDQKTALINEAASKADLQRMIDRFRAGDWPFLMLETEQCRISIRALDCARRKLRGHDHFEAPWAVEGTDKSIPHRVWCVHASRLL